MKKVCILGAGPSLTMFGKQDHENIKDILLINDHRNTVKNPEILHKFQEKDIYLMCNSVSADTGFNASVFNKIKIKKCLTNKFKPDWLLWQKAKEEQKKHFEGGTLNNLGYLPYISEDEPYVHRWRGPTNRNLDKMYTYDGRPIEHMPEEAEKYIIPVYEDKLLCNSSYYTTLYAILELQAEHIVYYGIDFYNNLDIKKAWYLTPPEYNTREWWSMRIRYEGEHMKHLYKNYLAKFFPEVTFEFFTTMEHDFKSNNIICNSIQVDEAVSKRTWYASDHQI